jgi:hypothetical protein
MLTNTQLAIAGVLLTAPTSVYAQNKVDLAPLLPLKLSTLVDAGAILSSDRKRASMNVKVTATLFEAGSKLYAILPQANQHFACTAGGGVGVKLTNIGLNLISGKLNALTVTTVGSGKNCGTAIAPEVDMTISTTLTAIVTNNKISLKADPPQVQCGNIVCSVIRLPLINAITPRINESAALVGAWIDRQIASQMEKYQQPPYKLKIDSVNINPVRAADQTSLAPKDLIVQVVLSGEVPLDDLNQFASELASGG